MTTAIEADYLVVGAGAMGMAFVDTLVTETDATVVVVDRYHQPGGHWTVAYPYVRLHQPSAYYGVNSRPLGGDSIDRGGWNEGLHELASAAEVCAYFDQVMRQQLLPSGRVEYFPMSEYDGDGRFHSTVSGDEFEVKIRRRVVDSTYMRVTVPSMRPPKYAVEAGVRCVTPNELPAVRDRAGHYTVVGAGKTGIDACLWLLRQGVDPRQLTWIMPRDSWLLDRQNVQPGPLFANAVIANHAARHEAINTAESVDDLFDRLETCGALLRISDSVRPTMYRCATVTRTELAQLRRIDNIIRLGRVQRIGADTIELDHGTIPTNTETLHIDCTADGLEQRPAIPVFDGSLITLQSVRVCQQVFSAALIAHVEATYADDTVKNGLCHAVTHPNTDRDLLRSLLETNAQLARWATEPGLLEWLSKARLNAKIGLPPSDPDARADFDRQMLDALHIENVRLEQLLLDEQATVRR
ncbi:hypothetical protein ABT294_40320 [Nonomuraea sp. NPDC000554]|uniref:hypothetical protein n=1 Tax=Nonomuraea sp. NPDC000554 TaxID=3154259 RepID=UPI00332C87DD